MRYKGKIEVFDQQGRQQCLEICPDCPRRKAVAEKSSKSGFRSLIDKALGKESRTRGLIHGEISEYESDGHTGQFLHRGFESGPVSSLDPYSADNLVRRIANCSGPLNEEVCQAMGSEGRIKMQQNQGPDPIIEDITVHL